MEEEAKTVAQVLDPKCLGQILALRLLPVWLRKLLNPSVPQFPLSKNEDTVSTYVIGL